MWYHHVLESTMHAVQIVCFIPGTYIFVRTSSDSYAPWYDYVSWGYQAQPITPLTLMCGADTDTDKEPGLSQDALNGVTEGFHSHTYSKTFKTDSHTQQLKTGISKSQKNKSATYNTC